MTTRFLIAAALMASACVAHADVLPGTTPSSGAGSDVLMQALYSKVSAAVGNDSKVSLKQGDDGAVYVTGVNAAKAVALAGDNMSVINTSMGYKVVQLAAAPTVPAGTPGTTPGTTPGATNGGGNQSSPPAGGNNSNGNGNNSNGSGTQSGADLGAGVGVGVGSGNDSGLGVGGNGSIGAGTGDLGNQAADAASVPEPSTVFLMLAGMLGVMGLRRRAR
jgi:hypothetical protein